MLGLNLIARICDAVGADATTRHNKWLGKMARVFDIPLGDDRDVWPGNAWILDAGTRAGGQYWRQPDGPALQSRAHLHHDLATYGRLTETIDREVADWTGDDYERIGVSFESPNHFLKLTGLENLRYFAALYRGPTRSPETLLEAVGLDADRAAAQNRKRLRHFPQADGMDLVGGQDRNLVLADRRQNRRRIPAGENPDVYELAIFCGAALWLIFADRSEPGSMETNPATRQVTPLAPPTG